MSLIIDPHHHVIPDFYRDAWNEGGDAARGINPPALDALDLGT